ncbi:hypothetical protein [Sediminibacterium sp.]|uniref:hypothetical protein n=1 Tax=Sediminibacterium sp. TaxID=1917865 RepID=UPI0027323F47|nr:hypothetical protein [Sediminibacterium sp.]MDP3392250.1 hypothetical protein [Sediminibacterium sp.]MDP3566948.1 hypothetical protein [Sediminibacterium sp.]
MILPILPLLLMQEKASLPSIDTINKKKNGWVSTLGVGMIFGILDLIVVKIILHPEPYTEMPPFLQPFPYSIFLYSSGALWFIIYATVSGIAMNAWQFKSYMQYGFIASLAVRLGHYLVWHIILGVFVEFVEL